MDKFYSYTDFLKAVGQQSENSNPEKLMSEIYLDLFLNRLQRLQRIEQLKVFIDKALDEKNEEAFYELARELNELKESVN